MGPQRLPHVAPGQPVSAAHYNRMVDIVNTLLTQGVGGFGGTFAGAAGRQAIIPFIPQIRRVSLTTTLSYRGTATAEFLTKLPDDTQTSEPPVTVYDAILNSGDSVSSGSIVIVALCDGLWIAIDWSCP